MMKIRIASDLHLEHFRFPASQTNPTIEPALAAVALIVAGDIAVGSEAVAAFANWPVPVLYIAGNHEFYGGDISKVQRAISQAAVGTSIRYLERNEAIIDGVRFLGTTLWTDYLLYGRMKQQQAMQAAEEQLNDHDRIRLSGKGFRSKDAMYRHVMAKNWLCDRLAEPFDGRTVVISHHAPHLHSVHPKFRSDILSAAFVSDLSPMMGSAALWVHGHVHDSFDYVVNGTRVIANPRGYKNLGGGFENAAFVPNLVVEVQVTDPILYLDYDGVLHHQDVRFSPGRAPRIYENDRPTSLPMFVNAALLEDILEPFPRLQIVLSTSWVRHRSFHRARRRLPQALRQRVVGATWHSGMRYDVGMYSSTSYFDTLTRYETICADALRRHNSRWIAIDDDTVGWPDNERHRLVAPTDPILGVAQPGMAEALTRALAQLCAASIVQNSL